MSAKDIFDVTIVGGGPAGLYAAFYAGLRGMKAKIVEAQGFLGGKINFYPEKMIWDVGGLPPVTGEELIRHLVRQGTTFDPAVVLNEKAEAIVREDGCFALHAASGRVHYSKTVILAIGGGIVKPVKLQLSGAEKFEGANLHYTVKSYARFAGKTVLISGGGDSALDWAVELADVAKKVVLVCRRDAFKGYEATVAKVREKGVVCLMNTEIEKLIAAGDRPAIGRVALRSHGDSAAKELEVDEVIVCHGYEREKELIRNSQVDIRMKDEYCIDGSPLCETSAPGIFAAGDCIHYGGKLYLIAGAFQDAANAVNRAKRFIEPDAASYAMVSSHNEAFKEKNKELIKKMLAGTGV